MRVTKLGRVYVPEGRWSWAKSHAYVPTPVLLSASVLRVYIACLDEERVGRIGYVDLDSEDPRRVVRVAEEPVLECGEPGTFDEWGVTPMSVVSFENSLRLYYTGWQRTRAGRYTLLTGVAESRDGGERFERLLPCPVLERSPKEVFVRSAAFVLPEQGGFRCWYVAGSQWLQGPDKEVPAYGLRTLWSPDGFRWADEGEVCFEPEGPDEFGIGRPWVWRERDGYRVIYSVRSRSLGYRLGYAESFDGRQWVRRDEELNLLPGPDEWDERMVAFGARVELSSGTYVLYNGNDYGRTGFGIAKLEA